jgi:hypothetical protein
LHTRILSFELDRMVAMGIVAEVRLQIEDVYIFFLDYASQI